MRLRDGYEKGGDYRFRGIGQNDPGSRTRRDSRSRSLSFGQIDVEARVGDEQRRGRGRHSSTSARSSKLDYRWQLWSDDARAFGGSRYDHPAGFAELAVHLENFAPLPLEFRSHPTRH